MKNGFGKLFQKLPIHFLSQQSCGDVSTEKRSVVVKSEWTGIVLVVSRFARCHDTYIMGRSLTGLRRLVARAVDDASDARAVRTDLARHSVDSCDLRRIEVLAIMDVASPLLDLCVGCHGYHLLR